jgi:FlaA1/EpsC-like NDP-sugar epimerase
VPVSTTDALRSASTSDLADSSFQRAIGFSFSALLVVMADFAGLMFTLLVFLGLTSFDRYTVPKDCPVPWAFVPFLLALYVSFGLYPGISISPIDEVRRVCLANTVGFIFICATPEFHQGELKSIVLFLPTLVCASTLVLVMRAGARQIGSRFGWWGHPVALFGCGDVARSILRKLKTQPALGLRPIAVVTDDVLDKEIEGISVYKLEHLGRIASAGVRYAIVAAPELSQSEFADLMGLGCEAFPHLILIPDTNSLWKLGTYTPGLGWNAGN